MRNVCSIQQFTVIDLDMTTNDHKFSLSWDENYDLFAIVRHCSTFFGIFRRRSPSNDGEVTSGGGLFTLFWTVFKPILGQNIFLRKSGFVTFLDLVEANLMQKIRKN